MVFSSHVILDRRVLNACDTMIVAYGTAYIVIC